MKILEFFLPNESKFFTMINSMASYAKSSSELLDAMIKETNLEKLKELSEKIVQTKRDAKDQMNKMNYKLINSFITPFDREDLQELTSVLYRITKQADKIRSRLMMQIVSIDDKNVLKLMSIVIDEAEAMQYLVDNMNKRDVMKMRKKAKKIQELEQKADEVLLDVAAAFSNTRKNFFKALLKKDVYEMLEKLTDLYKDGSDIAMRIILKHT